MDKKAIGAFAVVTGTSPSNKRCESPYLQQGVSSSQPITQIVQARSSVPERNNVRLRSFHTSLIDDYENGKKFEYDMNLP